ncbi:MAG: hypothetical protein LC797_12040, partial [Chloroflexi bacterium]|nr:hypothetical protein [Chloroflexota bacterium]
MRTVRYNLDLLERRGLVAHQGERRGRVYALSGFGAAADPVEPAGLEEPLTDRDNSQGQGAQAPPSDPDPGPSIFAQTSAHLTRHEEVEVDRRRRFIVRQLLADVDVYVETHRQSTTIPLQVTQSGRPESWDPVVKPLLEATNASMGSFLEIAAAATEYASDQIVAVTADLIRLFERPAVDGNNWVVSAPRFLARLAGDSMATWAVALRRWKSFEFLCGQRLSNGRRRVPWVCHPLYVHPDMLGRNAIVAGSWSTSYTLQSQATAQLALSTDEVSVAAADANVLTG